MASERNEFANSMSLRMPKSDLVHPPAWLRRYRGPLAWFLAFSLVAVLLAWIVPVGGPEAGAASDGRGILDLGQLAPELPATEDTTAFLNSTRWGISLREIDGRLAAEKRSKDEKDKSKLSPELKKLGYVGLVVEAAGDTVLLTKPDGAVARLRPGDALPDGRVLAAVAGNGITLRAKDGKEHALELFPRYSPNEDQAKEAK